ncbi:glycosyltransferase [Pseudalkalibacillus hwajinpoensis]|uniref:UDP-N-acetylglucosamine--N-acetylmuramyl-(Pentapeptide) pyrophosphoryl-undecaprenol N-acetylglucosamine transferase n=1 Tax=Guptibacillus hwajinpoensis TaxID=208199 RepID=A0A4U1MK69_9BACL|nr:glycosyltransferase [Pseudalkalibacillus hwajinpoensis]TKD70975.1 UDP-N-acetylglucosamine--N-acetylmuramyl-(pentapeptide) pyrophosphoryl-undecaprenol N-acetylglucosamine transferase [Pseudalkalibacillus hwajinpoensis]
MNFDVSPFYIENIEVSINEGSLNNKLFSHGKKANSLLVLSGNGETQSSLELAKLDQKVIEIVRYDEELQSKSEAYRTLPRELQENLTLQQINFYQPEELRSYKSEMVILEGAFTKRFFEEAFLKGVHTLIANELNGALAVKLPLNADVTEDISEVVLCLNQFFVATSMGFEDDYFYFFGEPRTVLTEDRIKQEVTSDLLASILKLEKALQKLNVSDQEVRGNIEEEEEDAIAKAVANQNLNQVIEQQFKIRKLNEQLKSVTNESKKKDKQLALVTRKYNRAQHIVNHINSNASARYLIGDAVMGSSKSFGRAIRLPRRLLQIYRDAKNGKLGRIKNGTGSFEVEPIDDGNAILFVPTNGAGLGHLTRLLAIARRVKRIDPSKKIIFHTTSSAMHLILQEGFLGYHLPSKMLFPKEMSAKQWNGMLRDHLETVISIHQPETIVFDGAFPYAGLVASMRKKDGLRKIWVKRGQHKEGKAELVESKESEFDEVYVPGEAGGENSLRKEGMKTYCEPVLYLDREELKDRESVRRQWNIPEGMKMVYVQLGAGKINDIHSTISILLNELLKREDVFVVIGESIIGNRMDLKMDRVLTLRDYPNSIYFNAFDLIVTATGYNTFHEVMYFGVPSILIPNENTKTDDQVARANIAGNAGAAIVLRDPGASDFEQAIEKALDEDNNRDMRRNALALMKENGAQQMAEMIVANVVANN